MLTWTSTLFPQFIALYCGIRARPGEPRFLGNTNSIQTMQKHRAYHLPSLLHLSSDTLFDARLLARFESCRCAGCRSIPHLKGSRLSHRFQEGHWLPIGSFIFSVGQLPFHLDVDP